MESVKGENGSNGVFQGSYSGYLYYLADFETVWEGIPDESPSQEKANLYRIPMNDLTKAPEKVVEGMIGTGDRFKFTEKTLYYLPGLTQSDEGEAASNQIAGTIMALDLKAGKSKTIVEDCGVTIYPKYAWDDMVVFSGWAYKQQGAAVSGDGMNLIVA